MYQEVSVLKKHVSAQVTKFHRPEKPLKETSDDERLVFNTVDTVDGVVCTQIIHKYLPVYKFCYTIC